MELLIFRSYLKFVKENNKRLWTKLIGIPVDILLLLICPFILVIVYYINLRIRFMSEEVSLVLIVVAMLMTCITYYRTEFYLIESVENTIDEYKENCIELKEWLFLNWVSSGEEIETIITRMKEKIVIYKGERAKYAENIFGVFKSLIIPIILLVITKFLDIETDFLIAITQILAIVIIILLIFIVLSLLWNIYSVVKVKKVAQMERFVSDLQGVLDICINGVYLGKNEIYKEDDKK